MPAPDELEQLRRYAEAVDQAAEQRRVVPIAATVDPRHRVLLAAAAVLAVLGLAAGLASSDDSDSDQEVTASEPDGSEGPTGPALPGQRGCVFELLPGPDRIEPVAPNPQWQFPSQPASAFAVTDDGLRAEVNVPGLVVSDLMGEDVEIITIDLGQAALWRGDDFTQLRRFDGRLPECSSFTVHVTGGAPARREELALAIGNRIRPRALDTTLDAGLFTPIEGGDGCIVDVLPGPDLLTSGPAPMHLGPLSDDQPASAHLVTDLVELVEIHVPHFLVNDLIGEDTEQVTIDLGPATLWRSSPDSDTTFTQLSYWDGHETCGGFAVTVHGHDPERRESVARVVANRLRPRSSGPLLYDPSAPPSSTTTSAPVPTTTAARSPATELHLTIDDTGTYEVAVGATITVSLHRDGGIGAPTATPSGILERTASTEAVGGTDSTGTFRAVAPGEATLVAGPACGPEPRVDENGEPIYCLAVAYWLANVVVVA